MPVYTYRCTNCDHEFEHMQSIKDDSIPSCPECESRKVEKLIVSAPAIHFVGSGFYENDSRENEK